MDGRDWTDIVVFEMGAEDTPAEFAYIGDDERGAELGPCDKMS